MLDTMLEGGCPTVDEELGLELIKELECTASFSLADIVSYLLACLLSCLFVCLCACS